VIKSKIKRPNLTVYNAVQVEINTE